MREMGYRAIMIVEDDCAIGEALRDVLVEEGYQVQLLPNGQEAVDCLRRNTQVPRLIIVDLLMPVMDGRHFCDELTRDPELAGIPVVVISGAARLGEQAGDLEVVECMTKPIDLRRLLHTIETHCPGQSG